VFWVALAPLRDPALVTPTIAETLGAKDGLAEQIGERELLLLLDNLEQVVDAAPELASLVEACPNLHLLVTSRELLRVRGEVEYPVHPLAEAEAVELFCRRSRLEPDAAIGELCQRLDDLPLAVELAAARTSVLSPAQIVERLGQQLDLLKGGRDAEARQQTLRATIEWSYDLLQADEQRLFRGLAVFSGGCTLEAAEQVVDAKLDTLQSLVDKNLLRHSDERFWMLETIRDYALDRLEAAGESEEVKRRHAAFMLALAESANLSGEAEGPQHHELVTLEQDNARAAIEWAWSTGEVALALRLAVALENFWVTRNPFEGMQLFDRLLGAERDVPAVLRARALRAYGSSCHWAGELERAGQLYEESAAIFRAEADELGTVIVLARLGLNVLERGDPERARSLLEQSLANFRRLGSRRGETQVLGSLGSLELAQGNTRTPVALFEESAAIAAEIGRVWWETSMLSKLAFLALDAGRADEAAARARRILDLTRQTEDRHATVRALAYLACVAADRDDLFEAGRLWGAIEAERARGRIAAWEHERETLAQSVFARAGPKLERGLAAGRRLSLEEAVRKTLGT
jgi:predicted ATPase